jgi:hypothetical protein
MPSGVGTGERAYQKGCCLSDDESGLSVMCVFHIEVRLAHWPARESGSGGADG